MQFKALLIASMVSATAAAPITPGARAIVNTRSDTYENKARAATPDNAVVNTAFGTYDHYGNGKEARTATPENAVVNTAFGTYDHYGNEVRAATPENAVVNTAFGTYEYDG